MQATLAALRADLEALPDTACIHDFQRVCNRHAKNLGGKFPEVVQTAYDSARAEVIRAGRVTAAKEKVLAFLATLPGQQGIFNAGEPDEETEGFDDLD